MIIGYHAAHEQFSPKDLLDYTKRAENAGFAAVSSSDHITPWSVRQHESGFAWSWLGAAMQATDDIPFGSLAIPGGWRYHPAIVAQAAATLAQMFPERFKWIAAGSGEAMNEHITGKPWPSKKERNERLKIGVDMIRAFWKGETVNIDKGPIKANWARIWSLPDNPPKIYGAALTPKTARFIGGWADGMLTTAKPPEEMQEMIGAFRDGGGWGKPIVIQLMVSWADTLDEARRQAWDQWRCSNASVGSCENFEIPEEFDSASKDVKPEDMDEYMLISTDADEHIENIRQYRDMNISEIYLHNAGRNQSDFIDFFGKNVLPQIH